MPQSSTLTLILGKMSTTLSLKHSGVEVLLDVQSIPTRRQALQLHSRRLHPHLQDSILGSCRASCPLLGTPGRQQPSSTLLLRLLALKQALTIMKTAALSNPLQTSQVHQMLCLIRS